MRARKPCLRLRFRLLGWNVLFTLPPRGAPDSCTPRLASVPMDVCCGLPVPLKKGRDSIEGALGCQPRHSMTNSGLVRCATGILGNVARLLHDIAAIQRRDNKVKIYMLLLFLVGGRKYCVKGWLGRVKSAFDECRGLLTGSAGTDVSLGGISVRKIYPQLLQRIGHLGAPGLAVVGVEGGAVC